MLIEQQNKAAKETSLIETINIISKENGTLKEQIEALQSEQLLSAEKSESAAPMVSKVYSFHKQGLAFENMDHQSELRLLKLPPLPS